MTDQGHEVYPRQGQQCYGNKADSSPQHRNDACRRADAILGKLECGQQQKDEARCFAETRHVVANEYDNRENKFNRECRDHHGRREAVEGSLIFIPHYMTWFAYDSAKVTKLGVADSVATRSVYVFRAVKLLPLMHFIEHQVSLFFGVDVASISK